MSGAVERAAARSLTTAVAGEQLVLDADRAVWWPRRRTLIVADVHLGKEAVFGRAGLALPGGPTVSDLGRLAALCRRYGAATLLVLGDFLHAPPTVGADWPDAVSRWLDAIAPVRVRIVAGNHDRPAGRDVLDSRLTWLEEPRPLAPFVLRHEPGRDPRGYVLAGHLHPTLRFGDGGRRRMRAPVFWLGSGGAVLPAFGSFTGGCNISPEPGDRVVLCGPDSVVDWTGRC